MNRGIGYGLAFAAATIPLAAHAENRIILQPVQVAQESVRFDRGDFVVDQASKHAAVQVRPASDNHGQMSFVIMVMNTGPQPINIDVANIRVEGTDRPVQLVTRAAMEQKAVRRAGWNKFFTRLAGGLAASAQANQMNSYSATTYTPFGTFSTSVDVPCDSCQVAAALTLARTAARVNQIRAELDGTRDALRQQAFQITTIYPGQMYGGRIFLSKFKPKPMSPIRLVVMVGDEAFPFAFRFAPDGTPTPQYRMAVTAAAPAMASAAPAIANPPVFAKVGPVASAPAQSMTVAYAPAPQPGARLAVSGVAIKWRNYYNALLDSGVSRTQAHTMADEQFGAID